MERLEWPEAYAESPAVKALQGKWHLLCFKDDVLYVRWENKAGTKVHFDSSPGV